MSKVLVIYPSVRLVNNLALYARNFQANNHTPDLLVIDEGNPQQRAMLASSLAGYKGNIMFYGVAERQEWCKANGVPEAEELIPKRSHDELSFGLLVALAEGYEAVLFLDDDTLPNDDSDFLGKHLTALNKPVLIAKTDDHWLNTHPMYWARGYPTKLRSDKVSWQYSVSTKTANSCLNMGCWTGIPDLNAVDYQSFSITDRSNFYCNWNIAVPKAHYIPVCSMNVAFKAEIIPAFYQLYDNNRYNDIFSGVFIAKIANHLGYYISYGAPLCYHDKAPRDYQKDALAEKTAQRINETLYEVVNSLELAGDNWRDAYADLALKLSKSAHLFGEDAAYITEMSAKMLSWTAVIAKLQAQTQTKPLTRQAAGKKGGEKVLRQHGKEFYRSIGKLGGAKLAERRGHDYFQEIGRKGGTNRAIKLTKVKEPWEVN